MDTEDKMKKENFVVADMHSDGVYFDKTVKRTYRLKKQKKIINESEKEK